MDVMDTLVEDHQTIRAFLARYDTAKDKEEKRDVIYALFKELNAHMVAEEEFFYPAAKAAFPQGAQFIDHAFDDHAKAKEVVADLEKIEVGTPAFDQKLKELRSILEHHLEEEEREILPKTQAYMSSQLVNLSISMQQRKEKLLNSTPTKTIGASYTENLEREKGEA